MNLKNNQIIAGIIFTLIWVFILVAWGNSKNIKADVSSSRYDYDQRSGSSGHPLWNN